MAASRSSPRVSVLLPVRDAAPWLEVSLRSLSRQSFRDFEVVALDDGSTDGSGEILDRWAARERRLRVIHRAARGLVPALNEGLTLCRGDLVARMDADDVAHSRRLELQVRALEEDPRLGVVSCQVRHFPRRGLGEGTRLYEVWLNRLTEPEEILRERFVESPIPHPSAVVRRRLLAEVGGYRDGSEGGEPWPEDYDLWLRLAAAGARFAKVRRVLLLWREHPDRRTRRDPRYGVGRFLACKAHHLAAGPLTGVGNVVVWGAGRTGRRLTTCLLREGVAVSALIDIDPRKVGRAPRGISVIPPGALPSLLGSSGGTRVLAAVASRGARAVIRTHLRNLGLREAVDFWCVA